MRTSAIVNRDERRVCGNKPNQTRHEFEQRAQELVWIALVTTFLFGVFALGMSVGIWLTEVA